MGRNNSIPLFSEGYYFFPQKKNLLYVEFCLSGSKKTKVQM